MENLAKKKTRSFRENAMSEFDNEINCEGLNCPLPILKTKKAIDYI